MNLLNLCLKIQVSEDNFILLGILIIIPYLLYLNNGLNVLKFYLPLLIAFANLLTKLIDNKYLVYKLQPDNYVSFLSSNLLTYLHFLFSIVLEYSKSRDGTIPSAYIWSIIIFDCFSII